MASPRVHNIARMLRYVAGGISPSVLQLFVRKGPKTAAAHLVRTGRMRDRDSGRGLPTIRVADILKKLEGDKPFVFHVTASHMASISSDSTNTLPNLLVGLVAAAVRPMYALEIGTGYGRSTCQIAAQLREKGSVVTIAPPIEWSDPQYRPAAQELTELHTFRDAGARFAWEGTVLEGRIELIRADSRTMDYAPLGRKFDFVFIDGSHTEDAVRKDTECIVPYLSEGAVVLWHDYGSSVLSHGVDKYLHQLSKLSKWPIYAIEHTTVAIQIGSGCVPTAGH